MALRALDMAFGPVLAGSILISCVAAAQTAQEAPASASPAAPAAPFAYKTIARSAAESARHTSLAAAVRAAGLEETLSGPGPYTVFAPTDAAFARLPEGALGRLMEPVNRAALVRLLTYHVVAGKLTTARLRSAIRAGGGTCVLTTLAGESLTATLYDDHILLTDARGGTSAVTRDNVFQSNGLIHEVDAVLQP